MGEWERNNVCLTVIGRDQPGIVAAITSVLADHDCNIVEMQMTILAGQCAMLLIVSMPAQMPLVRLEQALSAVKSRLGLSVFSVRVSSDELPDASAAPTRRWTVTIYGGDKKGIIHQVAEVLARAAITITDLSVKVVGEGQGDLGIATMKVRAPRSFAVDRLRPELDAIGRRFDVEVRLA